MATAKNGINGAFIGKVGSIVGYELNGKNVIRAIGRRTKPFSKLELLNQAKMKVVSEFLGPIKPYIKFGFQHEVPSGSHVGAFQLAQSYTRKNAIEVDEQGNPFINPEKVLISKGKLAPPLNCTVERDGNRLTFRWDYIGTQQSPTDRLVILLYNPEEPIRVFRELGAERKAQQDEWEIEPLHLFTGPIHVYAAFRNTWLDQLSDSVYCGVIPQ
ncbi:DUF6266 family protein [Parapedobacter koreensis]|uniref:Uncharacterized protein n=1 Tax=Parapedobacter koreensis TaxID=332977 RepID=A0A1H7M758_9SPHI|nr:DUF6266 family protein [Parapedobacter koreensis]SEL06929.1 hypothetical protein SAMN05421740_103389 [Parapedobacter koreensis]